jgi:hypothetical protein
MLRQEKVAAFLDAAFGRRSHVAREPWEQKVRRANA